MNLRTRHARLVAAVGAVVAAGTTTFLAMAAGTASADEPGKCTENVNIREEPNTTSRIVAMCEAGTQVMLGAERDGWVRLDALGGWASKDFVKADEPSSSSDSDDADASSSSSDDADHSDADHSDADHSDADHSDADHSDADHSDAADGDHNDADNNDADNPGGDSDHGSGTHPTVGHPASAFGGGLLG
jgi:uncharacterized protein YraI